MMFRLLLITLYILQTIFCANGQNVQIMPPQDSCVSTILTLRCPNNYVPIARSAFYGIASIGGSCSYTAGDCIADAMNIMVCVDDSVDCSIYVTPRKLAQCSDQVASYVHVEFDCVPISMTDSSKRYDVCQGSSNITSDHGIIESPGYPTQFQTTTSECFRAIHVPDNKTIRLWLTDLYIGSTATNCAADHVYVVDSIQTFRHCGFKRLAYPELCSTTVIIQYLVTTDIKTYRGLRMYFEIVDRPSNDICPDGTVTPVPSTTPAGTTNVLDTTTPTPVYVTLGIASPIRSFQLCAGASYTINCPDNYVLTIITNIFGLTSSGQCEPHDPSKDCVITTDPTFMCLQTCTFFFTGYYPILSCNNQTAVYQYVQYQCIPTKTELISNVSCPADGSLTTIPFNKRGRFQSCNYPNLQVANYTYRLTAALGDIMHFYSLDISLSGLFPTCSSNKLTLIDHDNQQNNEFCLQQSHSLIYSSCSNVVDLLYTVTDGTQAFSKGAELYIESQARPSDWDCGTPLPTTTNPPTNPTTPFTTPTATPLANDSYMGALEEIEHDICFNDLLGYTCPTNYTVMILGAFYGVKQHATNKCGFVQGDCTQEALATITQCYTDLPSCYLLYSTKRRLAHCADNYADYLHLTTQCVPSEPVGDKPTIKKYDVCGTDTDITDIHGILTSPNFPTFYQTNNECQKKIITVQDRILKIWINSIDIPSGGQRRLTDDSDANEPDLVIYKNHHTNNLNDIEEMFPSIRDTCVKDYLMINTPHVAYVFCGIRKLTLAPICANNVVIHYKSTSPPSPLYKGFKLYFEWIEKPMEIVCGGIPQPGSTTTPTDEILPPWAQNLELSPILSEQICLGTSKTLRCPRGSDYVLSIIESIYAVTGSGTCDIPTSSHCHQVASLGLTCTHSCLIEYNIPRPLVQCGSQNADYLSIDYECIPTRLPNNEMPIDICSSTTTDTIAIDSGMMISPQYPSLGAARTCSKKIQTLNYKLWMVFIVDLFLEGENTAGVCDASSLSIYDGVDRITRCGLHQPELVLISCSDIVEFKFISTHYTLGYRGFKVYFKTIDVPPGWSCKPTGFTTTTMAPTTQAPMTTTLVPPSLQILTYGGTTNGTGQYCKFPFIYQGNSQGTCLNSNPPSSTSGQNLQEPWCSITDNFDRDGQWGFCNLGVTGTTLYDICHTNSELLTCPPGYVIDILTADYAAKPDGSIDPSGCVYDSNDCFQSDAPAMQTRCAGLPLCTIYHSGRLLTSCQNRPSSYFHIGYTCIPNEIPSINKYDMCNAGSVIQNDTRQGFILSPNYPSVTTNIDCTFNLQILKPHQDIYLYIIEMDLTGPNATTSTCITDRLIVTADNVVNEMCGRSYTNLLVYTCHESVKLQLIRQSGAVGRGVKFYFEFRNKPPFQLCPSLPATTTPAITLSPTPSTTTTTGPLPSYFPNPAPRDIKSLCYPDLSGLMGAKNFQCPSNYIIVIHRAFYGHGPDGRCQHSSGDCIAEADIVYRTCAGQQSCSVSFINVVLLPECNNVQANYLSVEYQCLPTLSIASTNDDICTAKLDTAGVSGILRSTTYPVYTQSQCLNVTLNLLTGSNLVIHMYLLDLNIGSPDQSTGDCTKDYLSLSYQCNNQIYTRNLCGTHRTELLFSTCQSTDQIFASYNLLGQDLQAQRGFALLYHLLPKPDGITTIPTPSTTTTTQQVTSEVTAPGPGPLSTPTELTITCVQQSITLKCNQPEYVLVIHKVHLAVSANNTCHYSPSDCFDDRTNGYYHCGGKPTCDIFPPLIPVFACNSSRSSYLYVEHQCIPTVPKLNIDLCSFDRPTERVQGGAMVSSLNYTSEVKQCKVQLRSNRLIGSDIHQSFRIFILSLNLPMRPALREQGAECSDRDPFIEIDDHEINPTRLCGNSHSRYLRETCSNIIEIRFNNTNINTGMINYKGFEIYLESIRNDDCRPTSKPLILTQPFVIENKLACDSEDDRERVDFSCTPDHGLVFLQSHYYVTTEPEQCNSTNHTCFYPSEQPQAQCSGQQGCSFTYVDPDELEESICDHQEPNLIEFYYQCLPMRPSPTYPKYTFCTNDYISSEWGFIETPYFPNTYQHVPLNCSITIELPDDRNDENVFIFLYVMELTIRDTSPLNSSMPIKCFDSIEYTDGDRTRSLCGKIDQPLFEYRTNKKQLNLTLNVPHGSSPSEWNTWQGARLFFYIGNQSLPLPPGQITTTPYVEQTSTTSPKSNNNGLTTALIIIGILAVLAVIVGFAYYRYRQRPTIPVPPVKYAVDMEKIDGSSSDQPTGKRSSSISTASLKGLSSSAFVSPFYDRSKFDDEQHTENETYA